MCSLLAENHPSAAPPPQAETAALISLKCRARSSLQSSRTLINSLYAGKNLKMGEVFYCVLGNKHSAETQHFRRVENSDSYLLKA